MSQLYASKVYQKFCNTRYIYRVFAGNLQKQISNKQSIFFTFLVFLGSLNR